MKTHSMRILALLALVLVAIGDRAVLQAYAQEGKGVVAKQKSRPAAASLLEAKRRLDISALSMTAPTAPINDDFGSAITLTSLPYRHQIDTRSATVAADDPDMGCGSGVNSNTVWYRFVSTGYSSVQAHTIGSDYDTVLAIYQGTRGLLQRIACNDDTDGVTSQVIWQAVPNQTYYIEVADYGNPGGGILHLTVTPFTQTLSGASVAIVAAATEEDAGRFVIGTTGGDPNVVSDDNKPLLYGYPSTIGTSVTTLRVISGSSTSDYRLSEQEALPISGPASNGTAITTLWELNGIRLEQSLRITVNPDTGQNDLAVIEYQLTNIDTSPRQAGIRVLLDTQIGGNDGAPIFVPGFGRVTTEYEFSTGNIPSYWMAWEATNFDSDSLKAKGLLRGNNATTPNRLVIAHWDDALCYSGPGIFSAAWDYTVRSGTSITCDSAIGLYYNPAPLAPGQTRTIRTYYGLVGRTEALGLAPDVVNFINGNRQSIQSIAGAADDVAEVGDYFRAKIPADENQRILDFIFNGFDLLTQGVQWSRVGKGLSYIAEPGYEAGLHASWRGWVDDRTTQHFYKPLYDALYNNRKLLFEEVQWAGLKYYAKEAGIDGGKEAVKRFASRLATEGGTPIQNYLGAPAVSLGNAYQAELLREQDELLVQLGTLSLSREQIVAYQTDMRARQQANAQIVSQLRSHRDLLQNSYEKAVADENSWWRFFGPLLIKWTIVGGATLIWDGPGFYIASLGTSSVQTIYDLVQDTRAIEHDGKMVDQSLRFLSGRVSSDYQRVAQNTVNGLNLVRSRETPQIAAGQVSVQAEKSLGHYRLWPQLWWAEESSQIELSIANTRAFETTYQTSAVYNHTGFWAGAQRLLPEGQVIDLAGNGRGTATIGLKSPQWGESPDQNSNVDLLVLGSTSTGLYPVADLDLTWNPERVERPTNLSAKAPAGYTPDEVAQAPVYSYPLASLVSVLPGTVDYQITLSVVNSFPLTVSSVLTQTVPAQFTVVDSGGAEIRGSELIWRASLGANDSLERRVVLRWMAPPTASMTIPGATLSFYDPASRTGDTYTVPAQTLPSAWPLTVSSDIAPIWQIGQNRQVLLHFRNVNATSAVQGVLTARISAVDDRPLWSTTQSFDIPPAASQDVVLTVPTPRYLGYAVFDAEVTLGTTQRSVLEETFEIRGYPSYLPYVVRAGD